MSNVSIAVLTATYNAESLLPQLISSLQSQTDCDFEWIVADGGSVDATHDLVRSALLTCKVTLDIRSDCGIYDALNRAIRLSAADYYLVVGADDRLAATAIEKFRWYAQTEAVDFVAARTTFDGRELRRLVRREWLAGQFAHIDSHAVGLLTKKSLHDIYGHFDERFSLAADQAFVLRAVGGGARVVRADFTAGDFSTKGSSGTRVLAALLENFSLMVERGHNTLIQWALLSLRLCRHRRRIRFTPTRPSADVQDCC